VTQVLLSVYLGMFIRKKKNRSGSTSVVVVNKSNGKFKEIKTIGISREDSEIELLCLEGKKWISDHYLGLDVFNVHQKEVEEKQVVNSLLSNVENILLNGTQLILNRVFKSIGFDAIEDEIFKHLAVARLCQPLSKAGTVEYLKSHFDEDFQLHKIYRYLDKLYNKQQEKIQQISVEHTRKILGGAIGLMFYDVTTLYFEADNGDELRETGFSKDGKHSQPQVVLGLLVSQDGYPLSYSIFNGSQFEGRTMIPIIDDFVQRFNLGDFVVVADSGLMSKSNLSLLESGNYKYIIGARIRNESIPIKEWILSLEKQEDVFHEIKKESNRLIIGYSEKRAKKDQYNRQKGVERLKKTFKSGKITKENINKRGYNKLLEISEDVEVVLNENKIKEDQKWDGLKGYITNTNLPRKEVYQQYSSLWIIERAYRITKNKIEMRPMFVFNPKRIQAHICICFVAYKLYKELERKLKVNKIELSVEKVLSIAKTITTIKVKLPISGEYINKTMVLTPKQKEIERLFDETFWKSI
jgi:transposase